MENPKCRFCGERHSLLEEHVYKMEPNHPIEANRPSPRKAEPMPIAAEINKAWETRKHCPTCTCKRVYKSAAERQKAYRERHKAK